MGIWFALYVFAVASIVKSSNYDAYLADLDLRNRELHDSFRRRYPSGAYVLDYILPSPEFRLAHPVLQEYDSEVDYHQAENDDWERLLESLAFVQHTARHPDVEGAAKRFQFWLTEQPQVNSTPARARVYPAYAGSEFAPQDTTWGIHRVSGGSSEVGRWMDYAVLGAQAQEDDDDDEDSDEALGAQKPSFRSDVKMDQLPAYCDPPNPCPIGYDPDTMATPCDKDVENTAEFNRNWILRKVQNGECSCDEEHMESCPSAIEKGRGAFVNLRRSQIKQISFDENPYLHGQKRSNLVAKKTYHELKSTIPTNPYSRGHRLRSIIKKSGPHF